MPLPHSLLPNVIPPQTVPVVVKDSAGALVMDINWYLFFYNLYIQVLGPVGSVAALGPTGTVGQIQAKIQSPVVFDPGDLGAGDEPMLIPGPPGVSGRQGLAGITMIFDDDQGIDVLSEAISLRTP